MLYGEKEGKGKLEQEWRKERKVREWNEDETGDLESTSRVSKEKVHGKQKWSKEGKEDIVEDSI